MFFTQVGINKGIYLIGDILLSDGKIIEKAEIELKYDLKINFELFHYAIGSE